MACKKESFTDSLEEPDTQRIPTQPSGISPPQPASEPVQNCLLVAPHTTSSINNQANNGDNRRIREPITTYLRLDAHAFLKNIGMHNIILISNGKEFPIDRKKRIPQSYLLYNMTGNCIISVNIYEEETNKELVTRVFEIPNTEADEMTEAENLREEEFTHEPSAVTFEEIATEKGSITESSTAGSSNSNDERESEHDVSKYKRGKTRKAEKSSRPYHEVKPSCTRAPNRPVGSATDSEYETTADASTKVSKKKTSSSASKKGTSRNEKTEVSNDARKTEKAKVPSIKATVSNKINEAVVLVEPCIEEDQYGKPSSLALSSSDLSKLLKQKTCTICLPSRIYCTSNMANSDRHRRPIASLTSSGQVNDEPSTDRGSAAKKHKVSNIDAKDITSSLHALEYSKVIQLLEHNMPDNPSDKTYIPLYFVVGVAYFKMSNYEEAKTHFKKCEAAALMVPDRHGDVLLCNAYLGDIEYILQSYDVAARHYKTGIEHYGGESVASIFKLTPPTLSAIHAKRASSFRNASRMVQAVHEYKTAIEKAQIDRDRLSAHTSLGNLYQSMGDNSNALTEYNKSIELAEKLSDYVSLGWAHGNIGNAYLGLNRKDEAVHHLQKSLDLAVEYEQTPQAIGRTYNNLGTAYQSMNDLDKAEEYYDLALSQAVYGNDIAGQTRVYGNIGNVHMLRKNYERAIPHYSEVLRLSSDPATISTARHNRGCAYYEWATSLQPKKTYHGAGTSYKQAESNIPLVFHSPDCDVDKCLIDLNSKAKDLYRRGCDDLKKVVQHHEERLQHIKGSSRGLTLSVSLFESNSRTFHRLQDCLVSLHKFEEALVVAEQSRARTLGELLLKRKGEQVKQQLNSPLSFDEIESIMKSLESPVLYFSYTGARLICWLFFPHPHKVSLNAFEIPLADDQFNGKSFDYLLRYSLTENLVERSFEMYQAIKYDAESSSAVQELYRLVGEPTLQILQRHNRHLKTQKVTQDVTQKVTTISDSYTSLLPLTCLFDNELKSFLGDHYFFNQIPSLLTLGIINQFPNIQVDLGEDSGNFCVVGDPNIPPFFHNGELWSLGRLPHARKEAEWVSHVLNATPVLGDQATKSSLLIRLMNAKVVHIATHGSASAGFLAFASFAVHASERSSRSNQVHGSNVLLYPEDVEKLNISPALVVLSSCDSGRGVVKADGIQGMARAFILAGAQSVLTTLWKIPDESASVFMQFFYQYLIDKMKSTLALQKAILSVRCFAKYSQYIHWSGYQLTGRDIQFLSKPTRSFSLLKQRLGDPSIFPQLSTIKKLENALVNGPCLPTDVQLVKGCTGVNPAEVVVDFIFSFHKKLSGGIFWINCSVPELTKSSVEYVEKVTGTDVSSLPVSEVKQALFIFDNMTQLPELEGLLRILKSSHVHIIVLSTCIEAPDKLIKEIDRKLVRGTFIHNIAPLTMIHSTQRIVHSLLNKVDVTPANADQEMFEKLAEFTTGSPVVVEIASEVVLSCYDRCKHSAVPHLSEMLAANHKGVQTPSASPTTDSTVTKTFASSSDYKDIYKTASVYDSWDSITTLLEECDLSPEERLLLNCLSIFGRNPMPFSLVTQMSSLITQTTQKVRLAAALHRKLLKFKLLKRYPLPVVLHPLVLERSKSELPQDLEYIYVPQLVSRCLWNSMEDVDKVVALSIAYSTLALLSHHSPISSELLGVCSLLQELFEENYSLVGEQCYQQMYSLFLNCK